MAANCRELIVVINDMNSRVGEGNFTTEEIAQELGTSATSVKRTLKKLAAKGYIDKESGMGFKPSTYSINWKALPPNWLIIIKSVYHDPRGIPHIQRER